VQKEEHNKHNKKNWLLNWAEKRLKNFSSQLGKPNSEDEIHILNSKELYHLKKIEKWTVLRAGIAGAISAFFCSLAGIFAYYHFNIDPYQNISWKDFFIFWTFTGPIILFFTVIEFYYLYYDGLKSIAKIAYFAGLDLQTETVYISNLAKAVLEFDDKDQNILGINPLKNSSKPKLLFSNILYKTKIILTNLLLKFLVSRILGTVAIRGIFDLIAIPVTAFWDAWVCYQVLREARLRAIGPSSIHERIQSYFPQPDQLSDEFKSEIIRAVAYIIVSTENFHPNLAYLTIELYNTLNPKYLEYPINEELLFQNLSKFSENESKLLVKIMAFAIIIDGKITKKEKSNFIKFANLSKVKIRPDGLKSELRKIYQGKEFSITSILVEK